jgi:hypothetical protein
MAKNIPEELVAAKSNIEAAREVLEVLFQKMRVMPRADKMMVTDTVHEACMRLQVAQELLARLEADPATEDLGSGKVRADEVGEPPSR